MIYRKIYAWYTIEGDKSKLLIFEENVLWRIYVSIDNTETEPYEKTTSIYTKRVFKRDKNLKKITRLSEQQKRSARK